MSKINTGYSLNECPPMKETILYSIQQIIVAVFNVIPVPLLIGAGIGLSPSEITILVTQVDESKKRDYANKVGKELLTKASSRIPGLKADIE